MFINKKKIYSLFKNRLFATFFLSIISFLMILSIISSNVFYWINKSVQGNLYKVIAKTHQDKVSKDIVIIKIDEYTLQNLWRFPFSRDVYIKLIENLNSLWVSIIWFDIIFADRWPDPKIDKDFADTIKKAWNIVFWWTILSWNFFEKPLKIFEKSVLTYGYFQPNVDKLTKVVYTFTPKAKLRQWEFNAFAIAVLKGYYYKTYNNKAYLNTTWYYDKNYFILKDKKIPLARKAGKDILINFSPSNNYQSYSFYDLYDSKSEVYKKLKNNWDLQNKIVIVWTTAKGIKDIFFTPLGITYGVYIHVNILNTILTKSYLYYFDKFLELIILYLLIVLAIYFNLSRSNYILVFSNIAIISIFIIIFPSIIVLNRYFLNYPTELIFSLLLALTTSNILKYLLENKNKSILVKALSEYISEDIAKKILSTTGEINLDWENKKISIFFSDIAWFTTISEKMSPEKLVEFLREYLWAMSNIIMDERWFINKYEWDAIMALYGVFGYEKTSTYDNCKAALLQQTKLKVLNKVWEKQFWEILKVRMWLHTWNAIVWNIWAKWRKMEFTALGDAVNLASRLEWVNKFYGTYICVSQDVVEEVWDKFEFRKLDKIRVKWKNIPIEIYELLWEKWKVSQLKMDIKTWFEKALEFYFNREFKKAWELFKKLWEIWDSASIVFQRRCLKFEISWVKDDWDGVWTMEEK